MKLNKLILGAAALIAGSAAYAQNVSLHGYMDYTNFAVGQQFTQKDGADWEHTNAAAEYGSFYNGRTELNLAANAANVDFNVGVRLDAALGEWYGLYKDATDAGFDQTMFHQANLKFKLLNDQLNVYTGKFEEWNNGFILNGYQLGGQNIRDVASRSEGQHVTSVEWIPNMSVLDGALVGLRAMVSLPVAPTETEAYDADNANMWKNLYKTVKINAAYKWLRPNILFTAGFRPGTYYYAVSDYASDSFATNYFSEGYLQADLPSLIPNVKLNVSYDIRYRKVTKTDAFGDVTFEKTPTAHYLGISGTTNVIPGVNINFENRAFYADDHYIAVNEKLFYDLLGIGVSYAINSSPYVIGMNLNGMYAQDANGSAFGSEGRVSAAWCDDFAMTSEWMQASGMIEAGQPGRYFTVYGCPYIQKNFGNGYAKLGVEVQYNNFFNKDKSSKTQGVTYRVPVAFCFWY